MSLGLSCTVKKVIDVFPCQIKQTHAELNFNEFCDKIALNNTIDDPKH